LDDLLIKEISHVIQRREIGGRGAFRGLGKEVERQERGERIPKGKG
jgi:hypothetical protein